ncbi:MAG: acyl-CoA dehydrogenase family protein [Caldisphaeraceae archaeon]|nr:acyl-CoA dehydrogenase family protein [Caldisphaeraceae archaeon]
MPLNSLEHISLAYGLDHYSLDEPYRLMLRYSLGKEPDFKELGKYTGKEVYEMAYRVDRFSFPTLVNWGVNEENPDIVWLDPMEREVIVNLVKNLGVNRHPFEGRSWHNHYAGIYLIGDPGLACILTITIQTAYALFKYGDKGIRDYYKNLSGIDEPLWGATWFTEVQGGSDLGANETKAEKDEKAWKLNGYKYFSSGAGIADMALTTARIKGAKGGAKGLSLFFVPRINASGKINYRVRRLKWKSGTVAVPTGEVEFIDTEAYLIGEPEKGIYYTMEDLMVSRLANSMGAMGVARKSYLEAYGYASIRSAFGKITKEHPLMARDLLEAELKVEAGLALMMKAISLFDEAWHDEPPYTDKYHYARFMTHIAKNFTADIAAEVSRTAMEVFGGIGFLYDFPIERWHREALITPIWEGTSNIQALDMLEAMWKKGAHKTFLEDFEEVVRSQEDVALAEEAFNVIKDTIKKVEEKPQEGEWIAKWALNRFARASAVILLLDISRALNDNTFAEVARLYNDMAFYNNVRVPEKSVLESIISLRGTLSGIDWKEKVKV